MPQPTYTPADPNWLDKLLARVAELKAAMLAQGADDVTAECAASALASYPNAPGWGLGAYEIDQGIATQARILIRAYLASQAQQAAA